MPAVAGQGANELVRDAILCYLKFIKTSAPPV
jgi:hypothetical protein